MPVSKQTVTDLFRQIQLLGRSAKTVAGREPFPGLRLGSAMMLGYVESVGEIRCSALAEHMGLDTSVVSRQLSLLEAMGMISRRPDPQDGRAWLSQVTPEGSRVLIEMRDRRLQVVERALSDWDEEAAQSLLLQLRRLEADLTKIDHSEGDSHQSPDRKVLA